MVLLAAPAAAAGARKSARKALVELPNLQREAVCAFACIDSTFKTTYTDKYYCFLFHIVIARLTCMICMRYNTLNIREIFLSGKVRPHVHLLYRTIRD
jgi:hypothetical protein